jgi:hypothetical protein
MFLQLLLRTPRELQQDPHEVYTAYILGIFSCGGVCKINPKIRGSTFLRNVGIHPPVCVMTKKSTIGITEKFNKKVKLIYY